MIRFVLIALTLLLAACSPADRAWIPGMAAVDQAGMQIARIMRWCEDAGVDKESTARVADLFTEGEPVAAAVEALTLASRAYEASGRQVPVDVQEAIAEVIAKLTVVDETYRALGKAPPPEIQEAIRQVVGHAIGNGMRAVSEPPS